MHSLLVFVLHVIPKRVGAFIALTLLSFNIYALDVNTATLQELEALPGVDSVLAQNIINARPIGNINDLLLVPNMTTEIFNNISSILTTSYNCLSAPNTLTVEPIYDINISTEGFVTLPHPTETGLSCLYEMTSYVSLDVDNYKYLESNCQKVTFINVGLTSNSTATNLNEFLCTESLLDDRTYAGIDPYEYFDIPDSLGFDIPDWGAADDRTVTLSTPVGNYNVTIPRCYLASSNPGTDEGFSQSVAYQAYLIQSNVFQTNLDIVVSQIDRTTIQVTYNYDLNTESSPTVFTPQSVNRFYQNRYVGDGVCFASPNNLIDPLNVDQTQLNQYRKADLADGWKEQIIDSNYSSNYYADVETLIISENIKNLVDTVGVNNSKTQSSNNLLEQIEANTRASDNSTTEIIFPTWTAIGTEASYSDVSIDLQISKDNFSNSILSFKNTISDAITPTFPTASSAVCDAGVNVRGLNISICWTNHLDLLSKLGLALLTIASFSAIRIVAIG